MTSFNTISELLDQSGTQYRIFDMGRRIQKMTTSQFGSFEQGNIPYPTPYLHHAWLALMIWDPKHKERNVVWFLKFPLDEQGFLIQAVRDDFLNRLAKNIIQVIDNDCSEVEDSLKDNPFSFTPDDEKMAMFHAKAADITQQAPSQYYAAARKYFTGQADSSNWDQLGLQGIADFVVRLDLASSEQTAAQITRLPAVPLTALSCAFEHTVPDHRISSALYTRLVQSLGKEHDEKSLSLVAGLIRGLSNIHSEEIKQETLKEVLASPFAHNAEVLVAIATRCNETLQYPEILQLFLEKLAASDAGQAGFSRILADLMFMPVMRTLVLQAFRNEQRSEELTAAIGQMFGQHFNGSTH